jgi:hypothetical protein
MKTTRIMTSVAAAAVASALTPLGSAAAAQPESFGPFTDPYSFTVDCGDFTALVEGTVTFRERVYHDADGELDRWVQFIRAPRDTWTNTTTGEQITVRGIFQQTYTPTPDGETVTVAIRGFRYLVNEPGSGVTVTEVGKIIYDDLDETTPIFQAGQHDLANPALIEPTFCEALAS